MQTPPSDPTLRPAQDDIAAQRRQVIAGLHTLIYAPAPVAPNGRRFSPEHDPALRRRNEAVEVLGRFPDAEAVQVLDELILHGERQIPFPAGRWLRDTALLTLLSSNRLPRGAVDRALLRIYSYLRHPFPWQWPAVYEDLPLLSHYHKMRIFFLGFWLWPLLILAVPTLIFITPLLFGGYVGGDLLTIIVAFLVVIGTGIEIYLVHQVLIALIAGWGGPLLRIPDDRLALWRSWCGVVLALLVTGLLGLIIQIMLSDCQSSDCVTWIQIDLVVLPLLLLPMYILAHDIELALRYSSRQHSSGARAAVFTLRRATDFFYIVMLPGLSAANLGSKTSNLTLVIFVVYLFAVPLLTVGGLRFVSQVLVRVRSR